LNQFVKIVSIPSANKHSNFEKNSRLNTTDTLSMSLTWSTSLCQSRPDWGFCLGFCS